MSDRRKDTTPAQHHAKPEASSEEADTKRGVRTGAMGTLAQMSGRPLPQKEIEAMVSHAAAPMTRLEGIELALEVGKLKFGLEKMGSSRVQQAQLKDRELKIWAVIQRGARGLQYCRALDSTAIAPLRKGVWKDCPRKYESAYLQGDPWRHRIQDEKSRIRRKAELTKLAGE